MRREFHPDVYASRIDDFGAGGFCLRVESRMCDVRLSYQLRRDWGDPHQLQNFIDRLIGGTLTAWADADIGANAGREMARAVLPLWEREIHRYMEQMERVIRPRERYRWWADDTLQLRQYEWMARNWAADFTDFMPVENPKAKEKARQLLLRNLDAGQQKSFKKDGEFRVTAKDGKVYTIKTARSFNVIGPDGTKFCGQLRDAPIEDQMLAQKLLLQHEPEKFFANANVSAAR
jgi:hypothetical protein